VFKIDLSTFLIYNADTFVRFVLLQGDALGFDRCCFYIVASRFVDTLKISKNINADNKAFVPAMAYC